MQVRFQGLRLFDIEGEAMGMDVPESKPVYSSSRHLLLRVYWTVTF